MHKHACACFYVVHALIYVCEWPAKMLSPLTSGRAEKHHPARYKKQADRRKRFKTKAVQESVGACKGHSHHSTKPRSFRVLILRHSPLDTRMCAHTLTHSATRSSQSTFAEQTLSPAQPHGVCPPRLPPFWKDRPPANLRLLQHQIPYFLGPLTFVSFRPGCPRKPQLDSLLSETGSS